MNLTNTAFSLLGVMNNIMFEIGITLIVTIILIIVAKYFSIYKNIMLFIKNDSYILNINCNKRFNYFEYDILNLKSSLIDNFEGIENTINGKNYISTVIKKKNIPLIITITQDIQYDYDVSNPQLNINIKLGSSFKCNYRNLNEIKDYLDVLDKVYLLIEREFQIISNFNNFSLIVTGINYSKYDKIKENYKDANITFSNHKLLINSSSINNIYDSLKYIITRLSDFS